MAEPGPSGVELETNADVRSYLEARWKDESWLDDYKHDSDESYYSENEYSDIEGEEANNNNNGKAETGPVLPLDDLPDEVLLIIFSFLPFKDKCRLARVSKRWNGILKHSSLWKQAKIKCTKKQAKPLRNGLVKFMKKHLSTSLVHLEVCLMNVAGLRYLDKNCPNLTSLVITLENGRINVADIPHRCQLKSLEIRTRDGGGTPKQWWTNLTRVNFPKLESLGFDVERLPLKYMDNLCADFVKLMRLLRNSVSGFTGLRHLKLSLDWGMYSGKHDRSLVHLDDVVPSLESLHLDYNKYMYDSYRCSLPNDLYQYIVNSQLDNLKTLHLPLKKFKLEENTKFLEDLAELPNLETLYLLSDVSMSSLKAALPKFTKLKNLHLMNVDNKFVTEKHRLSKDEQADLWQSIVDEVTTFCPDIELHLINCPFRTVRWHRGCQFRRWKQHCDWHFEPRGKDYNKM